MAIIDRVEAKKPQIDLSGPDGNAFVLLGRARSYGRQLGWSKDEIDAICEEMKSSDYEHLITVFDKHFGDYVDLIRSGENSGENS